MEHFHKLLEVSLTQAETFMKQSGGFAPFAVAVTNLGTVQAVNCNFADDKADVQVALKQAETLLKQEVAHNHFTIVALCTDISFKTEASTADGILIRIDGEAVPSYDILIPYENRNGLFFYGDMIPQHGSLNVFDKQNSGQFTVDGGQ